MLGVGGEITRINATSRNGGEYHADTDLLIEKPAWLPYPIGVKPEGNKMQRLEAQTAKIEAGHVRIPQEAHWLGAFLHEVLALPNGRPTIRSRVVAAPGMGRWILPHAGLGYVRGDIRIDSSPLWI